MSVNNFFVLVKFVETNEVEVVSASWLRHNKTKSVWPNYKNSNRQVKAVSMHETPARCWSLHEIKLLGNGRQFESYHEALSKLPKVLDNSDAEVNSDADRRGRKRKNQDSSDSSDDDVNNSDSFGMPPPSLITNSTKGSAGFRKKIKRE
ncbi:hypothetical protein Fcan01_23892 [Folsomia candida]|uniref:Uncharacterized protein n=1 Tax=Folsomia candida TaxID=158441 RepID=A0A226D974_FOLCA|nr:hypothetical protein Fcan01_23892 [Folsomia candida]